jgi:hypothetical protein
MLCIDWKTVNNNSAECDYANYTKIHGFDGGKDPVGPDARFEHLRVCQCGMLPTREMMLFVGTRFSNLYTAVHTPA